MRPHPWRTKTSRSRELGVAAIEFALVLPFVAVIVLALVDYGYYFYIGINATEAARAAGVQASATAAALHGGAGPTGCGDATIAPGDGRGACRPGARPAKNYMTNQVNATIGANTTATVRCATTTSGGRRRSRFRFRSCSRLRRGACISACRGRGTTSSTRPALWRRW